MFIYKVIAIKFQKRLLYTMDIGLFNCTVHVQQTITITIDNLIHSSGKVTTWP